MYKSWRISSFKPMLWNHCYYNMTLRNLKILIAFIYAFSSWLFLSSSLPYWPYWLLVSCPRIGVGRS